MSDNLTQLIALAIIMAAVIMSMGEPDLIDGINYWLSDGNLPLPHEVCDD